MKADRQAPIGVFDSGVGGLTVVREIMRNLPDERIVYFGDTARVPYGSKSKNTVFKGMELTGKVVCTLCGGRIVYRCF